MANYMEEMIGKKIAAIQNGGNVYSAGRITTVKEYILEADGLEDVAFMERVIIGGHSEGYVNSIGRGSVKISVVRRGAPIYVGDVVTATGEEFKAMYSPSSVGHIIDIFGTECLQDAVFEDAAPIEIEKKPIPIMERGTVKRPLLTGIAGIDLCYPIGKGQRQLIIGDKKTGKTQIALDAIVNQKGKNVLCIYVAIGKTKKNVKEVYQNLMARGAMEHTIIMAAFNDEMPPVLFLTPYVAATIAENYMMEGRDVLLVIDDLKRHATVHREISLLAGMVPGREAYPPDVFYIHSRLLERGCQHRTGGSITILPIVETKGGDITGYIPTNIISITDGQIFLETELFNSGIRPAVNPGISVSRVGGNAQIKAMKKVAGSLKLLYSQYRELQGFAQFGSDLDADTKKRLEQGARIVEVLKQPQNSPIPVEKQVIIIYAVVSGALLDIPANQISEFEKELFSFVDSVYSDIPESIRTTGKLEKDAEEALKGVLSAYTESFIKAH